ncbi:MAG: carbon-nitrogen hydrolase family protein [Planctomycetota bacterium]
MKTIRAGICQGAFGSDGESNVRLADELVREAVAQGAELVALPEMACWWGALADMPKQAETVEGRWVTSMRSLARDLKIWLIGGTFPRRADGDVRVFNSAPLIAPDGNIAGIADKGHLFDVTVPDGPNVRESDVQCPGDVPFRMDTPFGSVGIAICYDVRFPEVFRRMVSDGGLDILILPAAFHAKTGQAHWATLLAARAIENQCYVVAANQCGVSPSGYESYGHSSIYGPWGEPLAVLEGERGVIVADLDASRLRTIRKYLPVLSHIRK